MTELASSNQGIEFHWKTRTSAIHIRTGPCKFSTRHTSHPLTSHTTPESNKHHTRYSSYILVDTSTHDSPLNLGGAAANTYLRWTVLAVAPVMRCVCVDVCVLKFMVRNLK